MGKNSINQIETKEITTEKGNINAIFIALDIYDKKDSDGFIAEVINKFTMQKMISPPNTSLLLITIIGDLTSGEFYSKWKTQTEKDVMIKTILNMLETATVVHGTREGVILDEKSLL